MLSKKFYKSWFRTCSLLLVLLILGSGCGTFNRDWKRAASASTSTAGMEGRWQGTWLSETNGHNGKLRCLVKKEADGSYQARFKARYEKVLSFGYTVPLKVQETEESFRFEGDADLGSLAGGVYHYTGHATLTNFFSTYSCKYDRGTFHMRRP
jgi:hypothetical protein